MKMIALLSAMIAVNVFASVPEKLEQLTVKEIRQTVDLMPGFGPRPVRSTLQVEVMSGGCTRAEDFQVNVRPAIGGQLLTIIRTNPDLCEAVLHSVTIDLATTKLNSARAIPVRIENPLLVDVQVVH